MNIIHVVKKWGLRLLDFVEIIVPTIYLSVTMIAFVLQLLARYVLKSSAFVWTYEMASIGFVGCLACAAGYAARTESHVVFDLLYNKLPEKGRQYMDVIIHLFGTVLFAALLSPTLEKVRFMEIKPTSIMHIPMSYIYFPFFVFVATTCFHEFCHLLRSISVLLPEKKGAP